MEDLQTIKLDIELVRASHVIDVLKILHIFVKPQTQPWNLLPL